MTMIDQQPGLRFPTSSNGHVGNIDRAEQTIDILRPQLERATGQPVETIIGAHETLAAIQDALNEGAFDEIILTSDASRLSRWAHVDLRRKVVDLDG